MAGEGFLPPHRRFADPKASQPIHSGPHHQLNRNRQDSTVDNTTSSSHNHQVTFTGRLNSTQPHQVGDTHSHQVNNGTQPQRTSDSSVEHSSKTPPYQSNGTSPQHTNMTSPQRVDSAIIAARKHDAQADAATKTLPGQKMTSSNQQVNGTQFAQTKVQYSSQDARKTIDHSVTRRPAPSNKNYNGRRQAAPQAKQAPQNKKAPQNRKAPQNKQAPQDKPPQNKRRQSRPRQQQQTAAKKVSPWIRDKDLQDGRPRPDEWIDQHQADLNADGAGNLGNLFWAWEGQHMPPPIWDERAEFRDADREGTIGTWLNKIIEDKNPLGSAIVPIPSSTNFSFIIDNSLVPNSRLFFAPSQEDAVVGHVVPRSWIPEILEQPGQSLQSFWEHFINKEPKPVHEEDVLDQKPFWEMFVSPKAAIQFPPHYPEHNGCDTSEDTSEDTKNRTQDEGSKGWIKQYSANPNKFMRTRFGIKSFHKRNRSPSPAPSKSYHPVSFIDDSIRPSVDLFVRSAQQSDAQAMANIYNHHVSNSVSTPEYNNITAADMLERFNSARTNKFPFIVACLHDDHSKGASKNFGKRRNNKDDHIPPTGTVIGFAFADDYHDQRNAMRFTAELAVFASPTYKRKGISKCLMDEIIRLLDRYYTPRGAFDILDDKLGLGEIRLISRMVINVLYCPEDGDKEWITTHLADFGFEQAGHLGGVSYKLGKLNDLAIFYRKTGYEINVEYPPRVLR